MCLTQMVLSDLKKGKRIGTDEESAKRYGAPHIWDVIYRLRKKGYEIQTLKYKQKVNDVFEDVSVYFMVGGNV